MNDQEPLNTLRKPGYLTSAAFAALFSFAIGLWLLSSSKPNAPADGNRPAAKNAANPAMVSDSKTPNPADLPEPPAAPKSAAQPIWSKVISALEIGKPTEKPAAKKPAEQFAQSKKTITFPKLPTEPWPPETLAFAGNKPGDECSANGLAMNFCWCPPGSFVMGDPADEKLRFAYHSKGGPFAVELTKGFWMAKYETTQEEWERVMGTTLLQQKDTMDAQYQWHTENAGYKYGWWDKNRSRWRYQRRGRYPDEPYFGEGPMYPIYYVNHWEATIFCQKLTEQEQKAGRLPPGWEYRLPTEAQWEYACRSGTTTATAFGDKMNSRQANFDGTEPYNAVEKGPDLGRMQPVGSYQPNGWGLYDMHGNAGEWCRDWHGPLVGGADPEIKLQSSSSRVIRGGNWHSPGKSCLSTTRLSCNWSTQDSETGFRVALVQLDPKPKLAPELPPATPLPPGILTNSIGMKLVPIPAGKFLMGSPDDEPGRPWLGQEEVDFEEQHPVTIRKPYYLGVYLVTQEQYQRIMGNAPGYAPSYFSHEGQGKAKVKEFEDTNQFPRENVSWKDAQEFCRRLSELPEEKKAGRRYRLPTEEEWEYACRAGTTTPYYFGKAISPQQANFAVSGPGGRLADGNNLGRTTPVGQYAPNPFGLYDMHGNVYQWCQDVYGPYQADLRDPARSIGHVQRGGVFDFSASSARSAARACGYFADMRGGFRVAVSVGSGMR